MLNKKPLLGLAAMSILATNISVASANDDEVSHQPVTGEVIFSGSVDSQCGVYATQDRADLAFGRLQRIPRNCETHKQHR